MPLGIKPTVDFVFKKIFGSPENTLALKGLLNAILMLKRPVVEVNILNPFTMKEFAEHKLIVLDVRCRDSAGRSLNVEMQISVQSGLLERLVYYACSMYVDQLEAGQNYAQARSAISICLVNELIFRDSEQRHHRFQMVDLESRRELSDAIEVHTVELPKYNLDEATISRASKLDQWVFLLLRAHQYDSERLKQLLPHAEFHQAIETLETIAAKTEDRQMYNQREKALRDYEWTLAGALEKGREKGREEGRDAGIEFGKIQILQELLGDAVSTVSELQATSSAELASLLSSLQERMRNRAK
ncbi:MAG: Rpn family recombination-promoting nuclease/putative transposase [Pirellulaceae bacterium]